MKFIFKKMSFNFEFEFVVVEFDINRQICARKAKNLISDNVL